MIRILMDELGVTYLEGAGRGVAVRPGPVRHPSHRAPPARGGPSWLRIWMVVVAGALFTCSKPDENRSVLRSIVGYYKKSPQCFQDKIEERRKARCPPLPCRCSLELRPSDGYDRDPVDSSTVCSESKQYPCETVSSHVHFSIVIHSVLTLEAVHDWARRRYHGDVTAQVPELGVYTIRLPSTNGLEIEKVIGSVAEEPWVTHVSRARFLRPYMRVTFRRISERSP